MELKDYLSKLQRGPTEEDIAAVAKRYSRSDSLARRSKEERPAFLRECWYYEDCGIADNWPIHALLDGEIKEKLERNPLFEHEDSFWVYTHFRHQFKLASGNIVTAGDYADRHALRCQGVDREFNSYLMVHQGPRPRWENNARVVVMLGQYLLEQDALFCFPYAREDSSRASLEVGRPAEVEIVHVPARFR